MDPNEQPAQEPAELRKLKRELHAEALTIFDKIIEGKVRNSLGIMATYDQIQAVYNSVEKYGIDRKNFEKSYGKKHGRELELRETFIMYYTRAKLANIRDTGAPAAAEIPTAEAETLPANRETPTEEPAPAEDEADTPTATEQEQGQEQEPAPQPIAQTPAPTAPAATIPPHLDEHKKALNNHIANIINGKQRAAFYKERDEIIAITAADAETQDAEILTLCLKVKEAETAQSRKPEPAPLTIRDEDAGQIIDGGTGEIITGPKAEAAAQELDTAAEARKLIRKNKELIPIEKRTEPQRDFKHPVIIDENGHTQKNPVYISADPLDERYVSNTKNSTDLAVRIAAELDGYIMIDSRPISSKSTDTCFQGCTIWNGTAFIQDDTAFYQAMVYVINTLYDEAVYLSEIGIDAKALTAHLKFMNESKNYKNIVSTLNSLKLLPGITADFNTAASQDLICLKNIIFNTATGEIIKATDTQRVNEIKKLIPYHYIPRTYDPTTEPKKYLKMVYTFFYDNITPGLTHEERDRRAREGVAWYLRFRGYVLLAGNPAGVNLVLIGPPHNGKTTLARTSAGALGDEYGELTTLSEIYASHTSGTLEQYSKLASKREIIADEGAGGEEKNQKLSGNFFKITSTARQIRGRGIYQKDGPIAHNATRTFTMNEAPHFDVIDGGTLRRMVVPPCNHHYSEEEKIDRYDEIVIAEEGDAILSLMINECIHYIHGNPDSPEGTPERNPGLLPIPDHWKQYKADVLSGTVYTLFLLENYEPIKNEAEKTKENRVNKTEIIQDLIVYATRNNCLDELGQLAISNETTMYASSRTGNPYEGPAKTLNKAAIKQLNVALNELGFGPFTNAHDTPRAYIHARRLKNDKTK